MLTTKRQWLLIKQKLEAMSDLLLESTLTLVKVLLKFYYIWLPLSIFSADRL